MTTQRGLAFVVAVALGAGEASTRSFVAAEAPPPPTPGPAGEVVLGERALQQFLAARRQSEDANLSLRVSRIGYSLARVSDRPDLLYSFLVVTGPELDAYSFVGGTVCLTEDLVRLYSSDDELAFAIAHELAHVALRHVVSEAVFQTALEAGRATDAEAARSLYGQTAELEADRYGALYVCRAGLKFSASIDALNRLARAGPGVGEDRRHPAFVERVKVLTRVQGELVHSIEAFDRGKAALAGNRVGEAVDMFTIFAASFPQSVAGQVNLGSSYLARARSRGAGTAELEEVVPFLPDPGVTVRGTPPVVDLQRAQARFKSALSIRPDEPVASLGLAVTLVRLGDFEAARQEIERLVGRTGKQPDAMLILGNAEYLAGDPRRAAERYDEALRLRPGWPAAVKNLALAEDAAGNRTRARELWGTLLDDAEFGVAAREHLEKLR
jgi:predicted Zn-dependent protease